MRRLITYILLFAVGLFLVVFFVANRQPIMVSLDPINTDDPAIAFGPVPLSVALAIPLFVGYGLGAFGMWLSSSGLRQRSRERRRKVRRLEEELEAARAGEVKGGALVPAAPSDAPRLHG